MCVVQAALLNQLRQSPLACLHGLGGLHVFEDVADHRLEGLQHVVSLLGARLDELDPDAVRKSLSFVDQQRPYQTSTHMSTDLSDQAYITL